MNGAESLIQAAVACGVEVCFANPGTTEMPFVAAFDKMAGMRGVLGLFEGVCTGAADGYGRMSDKPALTLLHLGPGFANGIANLNNARRANTPVVNIVGDQATWHLPYDAPLTSDIVSLATPVSGWVRENKTGETLTTDIAQAIAAAQQGQVATLIVPHDCQLSPVDYPSVELKLSPPPLVSSDAVIQAAQLLRRSSSAALFLGGKALRTAGLQQAGRIAAATGCQLISTTLIPRIDRGPHLPPVQRLPYFPQQAIEMLEAFDTLIFIGTKKPVTFFGYEGVPSMLVSEAQASYMLVTAEEDVVGAISALADELDALPTASILPTAALPEQPSGELTPEKLAAAIVRAQPENAIIVDEGVTTSRAFFDIAQAAKAHSHLGTGGAIGFGMPAAIGAAIACPDRPVINIQADGSALYTVQALWTQARESLNITTLICNNNRYNILQFELLRAGFDIEGQYAQDLTRLDNPSIDWQHVAKGYGIPTVQVEKAEDLSRELERALAEPGPHVIELLL